MYIDKQLEFSLLQDETTAATHISDNVVDLTHYPTNIVNNMFLVFRIGTKIVSAGGTSTFEIQLVTSAAVGLSTPQVIWSSGATANATHCGWAANSIPYVIKVSPTMLLRYMGILYIIGTDTFSAGTWDAFLTPDAPYYIPATP
jgi:hypothetical protein